MKKTLTALLAGILLIFLALAGGSTHINSSTQKNNDTSEIKKITHSWEYRGMLDVYVFTSDYTVKEYSVYFENSDYFIFRQVLPKAGYDLRMDRKITKKDWDALVEALHENDFMGLPERLPGNDNTYSWDLIKVETADGVYKTGSYGGDSEENMRFSAIQREINDILYPNAQYIVE